MANPQSMMNIDPEIIRDLAAKLPSGDKVFPADVPSSKWEYAMVFLAKLEECKFTVEDGRKHAWLFQEFVG